MVDIQTVSIAIASTGVFVAALYYILQIRHQNKMRNLDLFMRIYSVWGSREMLEAHRKLMALKVDDYDSFIKEHGHPHEIKSPLLTDIDQVGWFFNLMGFLVKENIVSMKLVDELLGYWVIKNWETYKPLVEGWRKEYNIPESYHWFEYLYDEMKKRQQEGAQSG